MSAPGYYFSEWSGDLSGSANPINVTMNANKNITANFAVITYTLNVSAVNGSVIKNPDQATYPIGSSVQLRAIPATGYHFLNWSGNISGSTNPVNVTMNANKNITANFAINTYTLTINAEHGSVVKNPNQATYDSNSIVQLIAIPETGYEFLGWAGDVSGGTNPVNITINRNTIVYAIFQIKMYMLNVHAERGSVIIDPNWGIYDSNSTVQLTAVPDPGCQFTSWSGDLSGSTNPVNITMNRDMNITANMYFIGWAFDVVPQTINSGLVYVERNRIDTVKVKNIGLEVLNVTNITSSLPVFTVNTTNFSLISGEEQAIAVRFTPTDSIVYNGIITFTTNDPMHPTIDIIVQGQGYDKRSVFLFDGFENGDFTGWHADDTTGIREVTSSTAAEGRYSFHLQNNHSDNFQNVGISKYLGENYFPEFVSFNVRVASPSLASGYFVADGTVNEGVIWFYVCDGKFSVNGDNPYGNGDKSVVCRENTWYHIEFRNIDWRQNRFDYYVDGALIKANINFRAAAYGFNKIALFNADPSDAWWDGICMGVGSISILRSGWNLVSVPYIQTNESASVLFPGKFGNMFAYNTTNGAYDPSPTLTVGPGYWVCYQDPSTVNLSGTIPAPATIQIDKAGWVLVGSRSTPMQVYSLILSDGAMRMGSAYRYDAVARIYQATTVIDPGEAVWINVNKACTVTIP